MMHFYRYLSCVRCLLRTSYRNKNIINLIPASLYFIWLQLSVKMVFFFPVCCCCSRFERVTRQFVVADMNCIDGHRPSVSMCNFRINDKCLYISEINNWLTSFKINTLQWGESGNKATQPPQHRYEIWMKREREKYVFICDFVGGYWFGHCFDDWAIENVIMRQSIGVCFIFSLSLFSVVSVEINYRLILQFHNWIGHWKARHNQSRIKCVSILLQSGGWTFCNVDRDWCRYYASMVNKTNFR